MRIASLVLVLAAAALLASCEHPRPPRWNPNGGPPRNENYHGGPNAILLRYDVNHDQTLTRAELEAGLHRDVDALDTGHAGCLTTDEVEAVNQKRIQTDQATASPLMDWNGDGCVDFNEFAATPRSLFDQLDKNGDGVIEPKEFNPGRKGGRGANDDSGTGGQHHRRGDGGGQ